MIQKLQNHKVRSAQSEKHVKREPYSKFQILGLTAMALAGLTSMIYEIAWTRTLSLVIGSSVYAFTIILAAFLTGIALGSFISARWIAASRHPLNIVILLLHLMVGLSAFATTYLFNQLPYLFTVLFKAHVQYEHISRLYKIHFLIAFLVMLPATIFSGAVFPVGLACLQGSSSRIGSLVGRGYAVNTLGGIIGALAAGWLFIPAIGILNTVCLAAAVNICFFIAGTVMLSSGNRSVRIISTTLCLSILSLLVYFHPSWNRRQMSSGMYLSAQYVLNTDKHSFQEYIERSGEPVFYEEGRTATVMVTQDTAAENTLLIINGKVDASSTYDMPMQVISAHLPLFMADHPDSILVIGFASGVTVGSVLQHPVAHMTAVEIERAVLEASRYFNDVNHRPLGDPRLTVIENDARNFLSVTDQKFDVIISEPPNPWITGVSNLFTREFFTIGKERLKKKGLYCQWVQIYQMSLENLKTIIRTFQSVFPYVFLFETIEYTDLILVGSDMPFDIDYACWKALIDQPTIQRDLERVNIHNVSDLIATFRMGSGSVRNFSGFGVINTDDNAYIEFSAPKSIYLYTRKINYKAIRENTDCVLDYLIINQQSGLNKKDILSQLLYAFLRRKSNKSAVCIREAQVMNESQ